ncbi:hypothetical protein BASA81_000903 [Batrachochytrium salamandrivorans]|nr:hypothetical protein BASA81_000903 [Batrachochytrium salamandrivorans]
MAIPLAWSLAMMPHVVKVLTLVAYRGPLKYDNNIPRAVNVDEIFQANPALGEFVKRCKSAHDNGWENLPFFSSAVLMAKITGVAAASLNPLVETYLAGRLVYNLVYMANVNPALAAVRSVVYFAGVATIFEIFRLAAAKQPQ